MKRLVLHSEKARLKSSTVLFQAGSYRWNESPIWGDTALIANLVDDDVLPLYKYIYTHRMWGLRLKFESEVLGRWIVTKSLISGKWLWEGSPECKACQAAYINSIEHMGQRRSMCRSHDEERFHSIIRRDSAFK